MSAADLQLTDVHTPLIDDHQPWARNLRVYLLSELFILSCVFSRLCEVDDLFVFISNF